MNVQDQVASLLSEYKATNQIVVALSGGIDSVVLLDALSKSGIEHTKIIAVHVHHGLNPLADDWLRFCQQLTAQYGIDFFAERVNIDNFDKGIEAAARTARYRALATHVKSNTILLTAQHQDDQAETLLLALKRGSGVRGLAAMPISIPFEHGLLVRPLLATPRRTIEAYAKEHQLEWVEDQSNSDNKYDRNFLRLDVLPALNQRWPGFSANIARSAQLAGQANQLLDEIAEDDLASVQRANEQLCLTTLVAMSAARINNLLRLWLRQFDILMPSQGQLEQLVIQMCHAKPDSDPIIELDGFTMRRYQQQLYLVPNNVVLTAQTLSWDLKQPLELGTGIGAINVEESRLDVGVRKPRQDELVSVRFAISGSIKVSPHGRDKRRTIKKLLQEYHVPTWQRQYVPFIFYNEQLVAALGLWIDKEFIASDQQEAIDFIRCN